MSYFVKVLLMNVIELVFLLPFTGISESHIDLAVFDLIIHTYF